MAESKSNQKKKVRIFLDKKQIDDFINNCITRYARKEFIVGQDRTELQKKLLNGFSSTNMNAMIEYPYLDVYLKVTKDTKNAVRAVCVQELDGGGVAYYVPVSEGEYEALKGTTALELTTKIIKGSKQKTKDELDYFDVVHEYYLQFDHNKPKESKSRYDVVQTKENTTYKESEKNKENARLATGPIDTVKTTAGIEKVLTEKKELRKREANQYTIKNQGRLPDLTECYSIQKEQGLLENKIHNIENLYGKDMIKRVKTDANRPGVKITGQPLRKQKLNLNINTTGINSAKVQLNQTTIKPIGSNKLKVHKMEEPKRLQNSGNPEKHASTQIGPVIKKQIQTNNNNQSIKKWINENKFETAVHMGPKNTENAGINLKAQKTQIKK